MARKDRVRNEGERPAMPAGWRCAKTPRRIAILGWARLAAQAKEGSGYNLAASELAMGLSLSGHEVHYLRSGMDYSLRPGMFVREIAPWRGIRCFHLFNSPNLSPGLFNFRNMGREMSASAHSRRVVAWLNAHDIEIVHAHSLEGFSLDVVEAIRASGREMLITPHNYWFCCPQVDLLFQEREVCRDYKGGKRCVKCLSPAKADRTRMRRRLEQTVQRRLGTAAGDLVKKLTGTNAKRKAARRAKRGSRVAPPIENAIDPELGLGFGVGEDHEGLVHNANPIDDEDEIVELGRSPLDQNERFLRADHHLKVVNEYGRRRVAGIEALRRASLVTPPSRFMGQVYTSMGLEGEKVHHLRLGMSHFDRLNRRVRRSPYYEQRPWSAGDPRPLRLAFFGTVRHNKGLDILVRAIPLLEHRVRQRCQFLIRAAGGDWLHRRRLGEYPEVSFLGGYDVRQLVAAVGEYDVGIMTHVWFENSPLVLLELLHAGKFVITSRLGGVPEWLIEPGTAEAAGNGGLGNGLQYPGGSPEALAERITRVVEGEVELPSARDVHAISALRSYPDHVREAMGLYERLLGGEGVEARASGKETPTGGVVEHSLG